MKHAVKSAASNNRLSLVLSNFGNLGSTQGSAVQSVQADAHLYSLDYATQWYCCASSNGSGRFDVTACAGGAAATTADAPDRNALQLQLQELSLDNVDALEALKLSVQVSSGLFHTSLALCLHHPVTRVSPSCHMSAPSWLLMECELLCANMVSRRQYCTFCCSTANWLCSHAC